MIHWITFLLFKITGLGKTTMATVIANEMGTNIKITSEVQY